MGEGMSESIPRTTVLFDTALTMAFEEICDDLVSKGRNLDNCVISIRALQARALEILHEQTR